MRVHYCICMIITENISKGQVAEELVELLDSRFFKSLSEPVRVQILKFLLLNGRSDIAAIAESLPQDRSVISRHLHLMQDAGILTGEKVSRHMYYSIDASEFLEKVEGIAGKVRSCMTVCCPGCC
jgi:DNA-binding transcriptional ArsR family regulator